MRPTLPLLASLGALSLLAGCGSKFTLNDIKMPIYLNAEVPPNVPAHKVIMEDFEAENSMSSSTHSSTMVGANGATMTSTHTHTVEKMNLKEKLQLAAGMTAVAGSGALVKGQFDMNWASGFGGGYRSMVVKGVVIMDKSGGGQ